MHVKKGAPAGGVALSALVRWNASAFTAAEHEEHEEHEGAERKATGFYTPQEQSCCEPYCDLTHIHGGSQQICCVSGAVSLRTIPPQRQGRRTRRLERRLHRYVRCGEVPSQRT